MLRVGIVGASGYAGNELLRLLAGHPHVEVTYISSRSLAGKPVSDQYPNWRGCDKWVYKPHDPLAMAEQCDVIFTAVPHGAAMEIAPKIMSRGGKFIDIGTDFRFRDCSVYQEWYRLKHTQPELSKEAAYGLPELFREQVAKARIVGNPGCYPTGAMLALAPLVKNGIAPQQGIVITSMSGVSGAGVTPKPMNHFPNCTENAQAYGTATHRHTPEIEQGLSELAGAPVRLVFTPHLIPMSRGILTTAVCPNIGAKWSTAALTQLYKDFYADEPFMVVLDEDTLPQTKAVTASNYCHVSVRYDARTRCAIAQSVIDNLVKGAAGQAIQNMNIMFGLGETTGLLAPGLMP